MDIYQWLCLLGVPTLSVTLFGVIVGFFKSMKALKKGVQALLRGQMISDYNKWSERRYAPLYARQNFENMWVQYDALGEDGVLEDLHNKFLALPTDQPKQRGELHEA